MAKFDFISALLADGARVTDPSIFDDQRWEDDRTLYRWTGSFYQATPRWCFDRWANSCIFEFSAPKTHKAYRRLMRRISDAADEARRKPDRRDFDTSRRTVKESTCYRPALSGRGR